METLFWECIKKRVAKIYWLTLKQKLTTEKEKIPSRSGIGETCFTSMAVIGGKVFSNNPKNMSHVHKDTNDLLSVIITLGNNKIEGDSVFYDGVKTSDLGIRAHVLNNSHSILIFGPFV